MGIQYKPIPEEIKPLQGWKRRGLCLRTDNTAFRLFTTYTPVILGAFCIFTAAKSIWGEAIHCEGSATAIDKPSKFYDYKKEAVENYCYLNHLYTVTSVPGTDKTNQAAADPQPGISNPVPGSVLRFHSYYLWIPYLLFFHALTFRLPHVLWKIFEGGRLSKFLEEKITPSLTVSVFELNTPDETDEWKGHVQRFANALIAYRQAGLNRAYAISFIFCELLNLVLLGATSWFTDIYLGGRGSFWTLGFDVINHALMYAHSDMDDRHSHPLNLVFPKSVKCNFRLAGASDDMAVSDIRDYYCVIGVNVFNEKIFLMLWGWYLLLLVAGAFVVVYRTIAVACPGFRAYILRATSHARIYPCHVPYLDAIVGGEGYSDWFFLKRISDNLNAKRFGEVCLYVYKELPARRKRAL